MNYLGRLLYWILVAGLIMIPLQMMGASVWQAFAVYFGICLAENYRRLESS